MRRSLLSILFVTLGLLGFLYVLFTVLHHLRVYMGWQENGFEAWVLCIYVFIGWVVRRDVWQLGLACAACNVMAYVAYRHHNETLRQAFDHLGGLVIMISILDRNGKWRRRLWGKIKSAALTAISAASFKRQTKEAFG